MNSLLPRSASIALIAAIGLLVLIPACGGGTGGAAAGRGLILMSFSQDSIDNAVLNQRLQFNFSEAVDPSTIGNASIQIREGGQFGLTVPGLFISQGSTVIFEPVLASLCDQSDSGFKPDTEYRVQMIGFPEELAIRNTAGQALSRTETYQFRTRTDTDPTKYEDQIPGVGPSVVSTVPANGDAAVPVVAGNAIHITLSENVDPCSINSETVLVDMYETGDPTNGFPADTAANDPFVWGGGTAGTTSYAGAPRRILCDIDMHQDFSEVHLHLTPLLGFNPDPTKNASRFPENALVVVQLTFDIIDYGGQPLTPRIFAFTTANLPEQTAEYLLENKGETPYIESLTTAAVHPDPRAPERVQGYMLFAGDGDNGGLLTEPSLPETPGSLCSLDRQANDGTLDDFDPTTDVTFDTGATDNTCPNATDGSNAVVWEFASFRIRSGVTVRIVGKNPAIILVQQDVVIDAGGRLSARPDNTGGSPRGDGWTGFPWASNSNIARAGGTAVAGGGDGGGCPKHASGIYGYDGYSAFGSADGRGVLTGEGAGQGGVSHGSVYPGPDSGNSQGGGGGGHGAAGGDGPNVLGPLHVAKGPARGAGGALYPSGSSADRLLTASAGGGGGGAGNDRWTGSYTSYGTGGGSGGAGGGFVDLTSAGDILIMGTIDASGCRGGTSGTPYTGTNKSSGGGGGGGAGGGIRLLTPKDIILGAAAVVTAAGGPGGNGLTAAVGQNDGGDGGNGRLVMEDGDSIITGFGAATVSPGEGDDGFYRGIFDANRFQGGGLTPQAVTDLIVIGNYAGFNPTFLEPVQSYGSHVDFKAGIPVAASPGPSATAMLIEVRGYQMSADGTPDLVPGTSWVTVGYFRDSGVESAPTWFPGHPGDITVPSDNTGGPGGFAELNTQAGGDGFEFLQFRFSFYLPASIGPFDPGAFLDDWTIRFTHDQ